MKCVIIPLYCSEKDLISNLLLDYNLSKIDKMNVDKIYFPGTNLGLENKTLDINGKQVTFINTENVWHQENLECAISMLDDDDKFIVTDSDCLIYDYSLFDDIFNWLNEYDIVSNLDCGTRIIPTWTSLSNYKSESENGYRNLIYNIPIFKANQFRNSRFRFAATLFSTTAEFYKKYKVDPNSRFESMEQFSRNVAELHPQVKVKELLDFRNSLYIQNNNGYLRDILKLNSSFDKLIGSVINSDDSRCIDELFKDNKYYHIRNFSGIVNCILTFIKFKNEIKEYNFNRLPDYLKQYNQNENETLRLLSWFKIILEKVSVGNAKYDSYEKMINEILLSYEIPIDFFEFFLKETKKFHRTDLL